MVGGPLHAAVSRDVALVYETLRRKGFALAGEEARRAVYPEQLARFRRWGGPSGHVESEYALADTSTGSSGHGFSAGLGFAVLHRSCGLATKAFVIAGDAETEEGMSYEARNIASNLGVENLIVTLDYNNFGIDGPITEALPSPYLNHWFAQGWNLIEVDGHNIRELAYAYRLAAAGFGPERPTVVICHTIKGLHYGRLEEHRRFPRHPAEARRVRGGDARARLRDSGQQGRCGRRYRAWSPRLWAKPRRDYLPQRLHAAARLIAARSGAGRADADRARRPPHGRLHARFSGRPRLPPELVFRGRRSVPTRKATEAWFAWAMKQHGVLLRRRGRPDEVHPHRQSRERLRRHEPRQRARPRHPLRHRRTEHGDDVVRHGAGRAARRLPPHDRLRHLRRVHLHDGERRPHDAHQ